jgi:hypothetical protein
MSKAKRLGKVALVTVSILFFVFVLLLIVGRVWVKKHPRQLPLISTAASWKPFKSDVGRFSAFFPGIPETTNISFTFPATNGDETIAIEGPVFYVNPNIQNSFAVLFYDNAVFSKMSKLPDPQAFLKQTQSLMVSEHKGKIAFEQELQLQNFPAREFEYAAGGKANYSVRMKLILAGKRVYEIYVVFLTTSPYPEERTTFFNSFKIIPDPQLSP